MYLKWKAIAGSLAACTVSIGLSAAAMAGPVYDGKDVTLIVPNSPAGMMSRYAQALAPKIAANLGANSVRVENQQGGGGLKGTNNLWKSAPDGMTIAFTNVPTLLIAQIAESPGVQFDALKMTYLGRVASDPRLIVVGGKSEIQTVDDVRNLGRPFVYASQGTDEDFYTMVVLADALGYDLKLVTGYEGAADTALAVIKGDADGQMTGWPGSAASIEAGDVRPLVFATKERQDVAPDVPTVFEYLKDDKKKQQLNAITSVLALSRGFFGPPDMDPAAVEEMRAAITKTLTDPAVVEELGAQGMPIVQLPGVEQQALVEEVFAGASGMTPVFKHALEQIQ